MKNSHSTQSPAVTAAAPFVNPLAYIGRAYLAGPKEFSSRASAKFINIVLT